MQLPKPIHPVAVDSKSLSPRDYLEILWRRKWWLIFPALVGTALAVVVSYTIPPEYRSSTLILVEPQKVPETYVRSTVTSGVEERLNTISQQILSRTNLEKIIKQFRLYVPEDTPATGHQGVITRLKDKVQERLVTLGLTEPGAEPVWEPVRYVERMRQAIEIKLLGRESRNAFTIAYSGKDPDTVRQVTDALASLFIEENLRVRERQAEGTSQFITAELAVAERELQEFEKSLKEFKARHNGALPEQLDANLRTLDRLQLELQALDEALRSAEERKFLYTQQLKNNTAVPVLNGTLLASKSPLEIELEEIKRNLARLQAQFQDHYPDIVVLKNRIKELEAQLVGSAETSEGQLRSTPTIASKLEEQLSLLDREIISIKDRKIKVQSLIQEHEERIEETYDNELKMYTLTRDYNTAKSNYESFLGKSYDAKLSESLERRQKGEQFRVLDPANMPREPYKPDRPRIILIGSMLSSALGCGLIFLCEYFRSSFRKPEELRLTLERSPLVTIPQYSIGQKDTDRHLIAVEEPNSIVTEQYRILSTKIADLQQEKAQKIFAISSSLPGDGKTITALNLAVVMARDFGKRTLLLEGDFKAPTISRYLKADLESSLIDLLTSATDLRSTVIPVADTLIPFADDNLAVLPVLKGVQNSSGLLSSQQLKELLAMLKEQYDCILIDTPPVLPLSDMNIFETVVDGIIMVVRAEKTPKDALLQALDALATDKLVGIVLNDAKLSFPGYHHYAAPQA
jgi:succinoglycan biosynthesis transport protein ExoP